MKLIDEPNYFDTNTAATAQTLTSDKQSLEGLRAYSIHSQWSGSTITGSIKLQASNNGTSWEDIASTEQTITAASSYMWNVTSPGYKFVRVSLTADDTNTITVTSQFYGQGVD